MGPDCWDRGRLAALRPRLPGIRYDLGAVLRFTAYAIPLLILLLALFGVVVEVLDLEPARGAVVRLGVFEQARMPASFALVAWTMEACGLLALYLIVQGRSGAWWLDGVTAGWLAWVFRGPLLVVTVTVATRQPQEAWWRIAFGWWVLYTVCGLAMAALYRSLEVDGLAARCRAKPVEEAERPEVEPDPATGGDPELPGYYPPMDEPEPDKPAAGV